MTEFSGRLAKAPVVYVLCQLRFSAVLKMSDYIGDIQEKLRGIYPRFLPEVVNTFQLQVGAGAIAPTTLNRWQFSDAPRTSGFILDSSAIVFHTTAYVDFPDFLAKALVGIKAVQESANIALLERVGLRYIDLVVPKSEENIDQFFSAPLLGLSLRDLGLRTDVVNQFITAKTDAGQLYLKFSRGIHAAAVPGDLLPLQLETKQSPDPQKVSGILDTDHFADVSVAFDLATAETILRQLQVPIGKVFKAAITSYAVTQWT